MSAALPSLEENCCPIACDEVVVQNIPGPAGEDGTNGTDGTDGVSAITTLGFAFTMPAELASADATLASTAGLVIGENVFVQGLGTLQVTAILSAVQATLKNVEDTAVASYADNAAPGTIVPTGTRVGPTGIQGASGLLAGTAAGDLKGNFPNPKLLIPNSKGALAVGNGTDANSLAAGTNGQILAYDSTQVLGLLPKSIIPVTGDTDAAADRVVRLSSATGTPIALEGSKLSVKDPGGLGLVVADATTGNARGVDAVDLQVTRTGATAVASGAQSFIGSGQDNTASGIRTVIGGGISNVASGDGASIGGGISNEIDSLTSVIGGGELNTISGGSAKKAFIGGGLLNAITGLNGGVIGGGESNAVSSRYGIIVGGLSNVVSGTSAAIAGGRQATADKYGQRAFSAGRFAAQADCQQSDLIWRIATTGVVVAPGTEMFLDGSALRATIAQGMTVAFDILVTARSSAGLNAAWSIKGIINNLGGSTTIATAVVVTLIADNSGATFGTLANAPMVYADDINDALAIKVTNTAATNVRWCAHGRMVELGY